MTEIFAISISITRSLIRRRPVRENCCNKRINYHQFLLATFFCLWVVDGRCRRRVKRPFPCLENIESQSISIFFSLRYWVEDLETQNPRRLKESTHRLSTHPSYQISDDFDTNSLVPLSLAFPSSSLDQSFRNIWISFQFLLIPF